MKTARVILFASLIFFIGTACNRKQKQLPILGNRDIRETEKNGEIIVDTVYHSIADFSFRDQNDRVIDQGTVDGKVYVADFFFASCPTICPKMHRQMKRVHEHIQDMDDVIIISHTMDPKRDSIDVLQNEAEKYGAMENGKWHFVTGNRDDIFDIGNKSYMAALAEDPDAPGGNLHSGAFILVDRQRRIRGFYDGTKGADVDNLITDIDRLRKE